MPEAAKPFAGRALTGRADRGGENGVDTLLSGEGRGFHSDGLPALSRRASAILGTVRWTAMDKPRGKDSFSLLYRTGFRINYALLHVQGTGHPAATPVPHT